MQIITNIFISLPIQCCLPNPDTIAHPSKMLTADPTLNRVGGGCRRFSKLEVVGTSDQAFSQGPKRGRPILV